MEVSEASARHRLEALETTAATCGPKERALSMITPRNFGREVVLRRVLLSMIVVVGGAAYALRQVLTCHLYNPTNFKLPKKHCVHIPHVIVVRLHAY